MAGFRLKSEKVVKLFVLSFNAKPHSPGCAGKAGSARMTRAAGQVDAPRGLGCRVGRSVGAQQEGRTWAMRPVQVPSRGWSAGNRRLATTRIWHAAVHKSRGQGTSRDRTVPGARATDHPRGAGDRATPHAAIGQTAPQQFQTTAGLSAVRRRRRAARAGHGARRRRAHRHDVGVGGPREQASDLRAQPATARFTVSRKNYPAEERGIEL